VRRAVLATVLCLVAAGCGERSEPVVREATVAKLGPQPIRYDLDLRWDDAAARLSGTERIAVRNSTGRELRRLWVRTWANAYGSCSKRHITVEVVGGGRGGRDAQKCTAKEIVLDRPLAPGAQITVALRLELIVPDQFDRFGRTKDAAYLGSALPTLAVAIGARWRLPAYAERGEAWFSFPSSWRVKLETDPRLQVAATGTGTGRRGTWRLAATRARDFVMAIGDFEVAERRAGATRIRHYRTPGVRVQDARKSLDAAAAALTAFGRLYGPYDRRELDVVDVRGRVAAAGIAMEYPELILSPPSGSAVVHEVAHQWFAFILGNDPSREPWLDESFAEFSASRLPRSVTGGDRLGACTAKPGQPRRTSPMEVWERTRGRAYTRQVYIGGACSLRRLQDELGEARFDDMMRALVKRFRDRTWTGADFAAAVRRAAPEGFDADAFLRREQFVG